MNPGRLWRTVRHLSAGQVLFRLLGRGRRRLAGAFPGPARARVHRAAGRLELPDISRPQLLAAAGPVAALQGALFGADLDGIAAGRFTLLNRAFDFGHPDDIPWRGEFFEGDNPLRRMTLAYMGYAVPLLARGRAADADTVLAVLRSLEAQNPFSVPGVFRDVWNPYSASHRLINLLAGLALYRDTGNAPPAAAEAEILAHVRFCAAFVRGNLERDLQYNHLMKNLTALAFYCAGLDAVPRALAVVRTAVPACLGRCVLGDGGHAERSPMYHLLAMLDVDVLRACGHFPGDWQPRLDETRAKMADALAVMTHPDGDIALFNDSWIGEAPPSFDLIGTSAIPATARLAETGYVRLHHGGDAVLFDCGPCGPDDNPGHAHADLLSLELSVAGRRLIVDHGVSTYTAGALRDLARSAESHNGPRLAGVETIELWQSFRVGRRGTAVEIVDQALAGLAPLWCAGRHDGYRHVGNQVRRFVGLWPGKAALICDLWLGPCRFAEASSFLVPDGWRHVPSVPMTFVGETARIKLAALAGHLGDATPARFWPRFGVQQQAHAVTVTPEETGGPKETGGPEETGGAKETGGARRSALWIVWSDNAVPPDRSALAGLFDRLAGC